MKKLLLLMVLLLVVVACQQETVTETEPQPEPEVNQIRNYETEGSPVITFFKTPTGQLEAGETYEFGWIAEGGVSIKNTHVQGSYDVEFSEPLTSRESNNGPGQYRGILTVGEEGTMYFRAFATIDGEPYYSEVIEREVVAPGTVS